MHKWNPISLKIGIGSALQEKTSLLPEKPIVIKQENVLPQRLFLNRER